MMLAACKKWSELMCFICK